VAMKFSLTNSCHLEPTIAAVAQLILQHVEESQDHWSGTDTGASVGGFRFSTVTEQQQDQATVILCRSNKGMVNALEEMMRACSGKVPSWKFLYNCNVSSEMYF
jgi:hypothetical protein